MNENELRQALAGHAASVAPVTDVARLEAGLVRVDRLRAIRTACAGAAVGAAAVFGALSLTADAESTSVDVVDAPVIEPAPDTDPPVIGDAEADEAAGTDDVVATTVAPTTVPPTTAPPSTAPPTTDDQPAHLTSSETTTTLAPAPTSTAAPATTAPPTTAAPTTTAPPATTTTAAPATTTTVPASIDFTAAARYGTCAEDPPYDEYSGTADPGTVVTITSAHSAPAQVTADGDGNWFLRVEFPSAPPNEHFTVSVGDGVTTFAFDFVHTV